MDEGQQAARLSSEATGGPSEAAGSPNSAPRSRGQAAGLGALIRAKPLPARRDRQPLQLRRDRRPIPADQGRARASAQGGVVVVVRAHLRGKRHRQGAGRPRCPLPEQPQQRPICQGQLRCSADRISRKRVVWPRARGLYQRGAPPEGQVRVGRGRDDFFGRDRRCPVGDPSSAVAGVAGKAVRPRGGRAAARCRCAGGGRDQPAAQAHG